MGNRPLKSHPVQKCHFLCGKYLTLLNRKIKVYRYTLNKENRVSLNSYIILPRAKKNKFTFLNHFETLCIQKILGEGNQRNKV